MASPKTAKNFGQALKKAWDVLNKYDTPEVATKLTGDERAKYLAALDKVYGNKESRIPQVLTANYKKGFHGSGVPLTEFSDDYLGQYDKMSQSDIGHWFTDKKKVAEYYAKRGGGGAAYDIPKDKAEKEELIYLVKKAFSNAYPGGAKIDDKMALEIAQGKGDVGPEFHKALEDAHSYSDLDFELKRTTPKGYVGEYYFTSNPLEKDMRGENPWFGNREAKTEALEKGKNSIEFQNAAEAISDDGGTSLSNSTAVFKPNQIRSTDAAFDPRFKDSPLLMAGAGVGIGNKYEINRNDPNAPLREGGKALLGAAKKANDWYQENIVGPAAAVLKSQMTPKINVRGQEFETGNALTDMGQEILVDPTSYIEGPIAAGVTAAQIAAEMAPQKKSKGGMVYKPKAEYIEKLYKGGKITKETAARCGYAEGGLVDPAKIDVSQIQIDPSLMQAGQAMPAPMPQAMPQVSVNPFSAVTRGIENLREKIANEPTMVEEARQKYLASQNPNYQLASAQGSMPAEGAVQLEQFGQAQASPQDGMQQMPGGGAESAINQAVNAGMVEGVQTGAAIKTMQDTLRAAADDEKQKAALAQEDFKAKQLEIDDLVGQYQKAAPNPQAAREQFWADKTTGQKILGGIGLIFGAMSKDGINRSVGMIEKAIDQNLEAQAKKQQSLGSLIGEKRGMLGDLRKMYGDERDARMAFKDQALKIAQLEIDKVASMTKSADVRAKYALAKEELGMKRMQVQSELLKSAGKGKELLVPGVGYAATAGEATKAKELLGARNKSTSLIKDLLKYDRALPGSKESGDAEVSAELLRAALRPIILGQGTVQEKEYERLKAIATNPTEIFQIRNKSKLQRLLQIVDSQVNAELSGMGLVPPQVQLKERAR